MEATYIFYTKQKQRLYAGLMGGAMIVAGIPAYFSDPMLIILIPIHVIGVSSFTFCCIYSYKRPLFVLTETTLKMDTTSKQIVFNWKDIIAYHITEKGRQKILTVLAQGVTAERNISNLDKSPYEILTLLNMYKNRPNRPETP